MKMEFNVLGVAGSMRRGSYSTQALKTALEHAKKHGANVRLLDIDKMPLYDPNAPASAEVERAAEAVAWADALILASPDYHGSMSGTLKNFLDHFYEEFAGKLFGYIVASHEKGLTVMEQMRTAVRQCYGWSMPYGVSVHGELDFRGSQITSDRVAKRIRMLARDIIAYGAPIRDQFVKDLGGSEPDTFAAHYR